MENCGTCKFWLKLVDTPESYGCCIWFQQNAIPAMPGWASVSTEYGAISPNYEGCPVYKAAKGRG